MKTCPVCNGRGEDLELGKWVECKICKGVGILREGDTSSLIESLRDNIGPYCLEYGKTEFYSQEDKFQAMKDEYYIRYGTEDNFLVWVTDRVSLVLAVEKLRKWGERNNVGVMV